MQTLTRPRPFAYQSAFTPGRFGAPARTFMGQYQGYLTTPPAQLTQAQRDDWLAKLDALAARINQANTILQQNALNLTTILGADYQAFNGCRQIAENGTPSGSNDTNDVVVANLGMRLQSGDTTQWYVTAVEDQAYNLLKNAIDCMLGYWQQHQAPAPQPSGGGGGPAPQPTPQGPTGPSTTVLVGGAIGLAALIAIIAAVS